MTFIDVTPVGADSGFSNFKIATLENTYMFPNIASLGKPRVFEDLSPQDILSNLDIAFDYNGQKKHYWVGKMAMVSGKNANYIDKFDRFNSEEGRATFLAALAMVCKGDGENFVVGTGLPMEDYRTNLKKTYEETLIGSYAVTFNSGPFEGQVKRFNIISCKVWPQGLGIIFDQLLTKDGQQRQEHPLLEPGSVSGMVDVGMRTTNLGIFEDYTLAEGFSLSIEYGMSMVHDQLKQFLHKRDLPVEDRDIEQILWRDNFKGLDIKTVRENALKALAEIICQEALTKWRGKVLLDKVYVGGGAGHAVYEKLQFGEKIDKILVENPQHANANGFLKAAVGLTLAGKVRDAHGATAKIEITS